MWLSGPGEGAEVGSDHVGAALMAHLGPAFCSD